MKLLRHGARGAQKPGMLASDCTIRALSGVVADISGDVLGDAGLARLRGLDPLTLPVVPADTRLGACVAGTTKFICIGLNYADHAAESGMSVPPEPVIFMKANSAICGPTDPCTVAVKKAAASGAEADIKKARKLFMALKSTHRIAALGMLRE